MNPSNDSASRCRNSGYWRSTAILLILGICGSAGAADVAPRIDAILSPWSGHGPGVIVTVVHNAQVVFAKGYGLADVEGGIPMQVTSHVGLDSLTKQFTAAAIILLERQGALGYDDELSKHVPQVHARGVTIRKLLQHRSGLPDLAGGLPGDATLADLVHAFAVTDLSHIPRPAPYSYNNSGYALLAAVIEHASHRSYVEFVRQELLLPSGMHETSVALPDAPAAAVVRAYRQGQVYEAPVGAQMIGAGGMITTSPDMAKWYATLDEGRLIPGYQREIERLGLQSKGTSHAPAYGGGWVVGRSGSITRWSHGGSWRGSKNYVLRYPAKKLTVVLFANSHEFGANRHRVAYEIAKLFLPELDAAGPDVATLEDACVTYKIKRTHAGRFAIDGAEDIGAWRHRGQWMHDPWPYGSELEASSFAPCN